MAQRPEKAAEYTAAYRERNYAELLVRGRQAAAERRAAHPEHMADVRRKAYIKKTTALGNTWRPQGVLYEHEVVARIRAEHLGAIEYVGGYKNMLSPATFRCAAHGLEFSALVHNVARGANPCTKCNHMRSRGEFEVLGALSTFGTVQSRVRNVLEGRQEIDVYMPEHRLAVEYCGDYWHSTKDADDERASKHKHFHKYQACQDRGLRLITLYESEWRRHRYAIQRLLRNAVGKSKGKLMARKCELRKVASAAARGFYDRYHPQGGSGNGEHYALFWKGKMVACMRFVLGANDRGAAAANRTWTLGRYATRVTVAGAASRLFKAFLTEHNPTEVKSFSDNRFFDGGMYAQLGFSLDAELAPDYAVFHPRLGLLAKAQYQRRLLPKRLAEVGSNIVFDPATDYRTEQDITYAMGARRLYDCGKKRWVWTPSTQQCHNALSPGNPGVSDGPGRRQAD